MRSKDEIREAVWAAMELAGAGHTKKLHDKIPHFRGFEEAAARVFDLPTWHAALVIKGNPDKAQRPVRRQALAEGKVVYMAVPRLKQEQCFVELDPAVLRASPDEASTIAGAFRYGRPVYVEDMRPVGPRDIGVGGRQPIGRPGRQGGRLRRLGIRLGHCRRNHLAPNASDIDRAPHASPRRRTAVHSSRRVPGLRRHRR